jgi:hypothetical protein
MVPKLLRRLAGRAASSGDDESLAGQAHDPEPQTQPELAVGPLPSAWVKMHVWRRDHGRCVRCASHEGVWFHYVVPVWEGGSATEGNIRLMCGRCRRGAHSESRRRKRSRV